MERARWLGVLRANAWLRHARDGGAGVKSKSRPEETRTPDFYSAIVALSQLSYRPKHRTIITKRRAYGSFEQSIDAQRALGQQICPRESADSGILVRMI